MLLRMVTRSRGLAAAYIAIAVLAAGEIASAQVSVQFGRGGISVGPGYSPYRGSGYNPYLGGAYNRGSRNDWYYDRYQPRGYGQLGGRGPNWGSYRNPSLYGPAGPYSGYGYGYDQHGHQR